ncbi:Glycosyltransferase involved in cell wall bisynthesis [Halorubrum aquaticum]|uniref:Glycosyltransferase involved in cell wall bisynthesis n=1 Tax=Halorubrum aquaticum TaxID=387340 RepID=A0A1I3CJ61_9EURY|nr:glycosyltransferase family 4 protein [Halorubrum aquaticum]SFH74542.1 Glycosyltransferase involved in cell wall bisynthesis [Halorubrum aquaticum]
MGGRGGGSEGDALDADEVADTPHVGIVVYGDLDARSGGFLYDRRLADHLGDHGWTVEVVSLPERPYRRSLLTNLAPGLVERLERVDVVLEDAYCGPSLFLANRRLETPVVALVHYLRSAVVGESVGDRAVRAIERDYLRTADAYVFNSRPTRDAVAELCGVDDDEEQITFPGVVAPPAGDRLGTAPALSGDRLARDPFRVVAVGNVTPRKGIATLIRGLSLLDDGIDWRLRVVGDVGVAPDHVASLRALADRRGVTDLVEFAGRVDDDALREELRSAHVLAVPSRYEPFGIVYLEGMAFGLPAIASANGGASDFVGDHNGALVPPGDAEAVADAIGSLARDRERLRRLSEAARETFREHPTWEETCDRVRRFLRGIVEDDSGSGSTEVAGSREHQM